MQFSPYYLRFKQQLSFTALTKCLQLRVAVLYVEKQETFSYSPSTVLAKLDINKILYNYSELVKEQKLSYFSN